MPAYEEPPVLPGGSYLYESQFHFPFQNLPDGIVKRINVNTSIQYSGIDSLILDCVFRGTQQEIMKRSATLTSVHTVQVQTSKSV